MGGVASGASCPYRDLYIYALEGRVLRADESGFGSEFIGNWVEGDSSFLFFKEPADERVARLLAQRPELALSERYQFDYEEWQGGGLDCLSAEGVTFRAPWSRAGTDDGRTLLLDPGVVFGNGVHPTTRDCLSALAEAHARFPFHSVLDLGTGTGILALFAVAVGAERVLAVDLNPLCVRTAVRNVALNGFSDLIQVVEGRAEDFCRNGVDVVVANIHAEVIKSLLAVEAFLQSPVLIISGLLRTPFREIREKIRAAGYDIHRVYEHEMTWHTLMAVGPAAIDRAMGRFPGEF